jgi:hypothetical protein
MDRFVIIFDFMGSRFEKKIRGGRSGANGEESEYDQLV